MSSYIDDTFERWPVILGPSAKWLLGNTQSRVRIANLEKSRTHPELLLTCGDSMVISSISRGKRIEELPRNQPRSGICMR